jgi:hypothetical protein
MVAVSADEPFQPAAVANVARFALVWLVEMVKAKALASLPNSICIIPDISGHVPGDKAHSA